ncbi:hypothetical protein IHN58_19895, partial [Deinococcus sp. 12RED42]|nr:hypothetical protein [Deinococcus sp. 12RED42]
MRKRSGWAVAGRVALGVTAALLLSAGGAAAWLHLSAQARHAGSAPVGGLG